MKQTVRLNENELRGLINECVMEILNEECDENWQNNPILQGVRGFMKGKVDNQKEVNPDPYQQRISNLMQRFSNAKNVYQNQKQYTNLTNLRKELQALVKNGTINDNMTVGEILGNFGALATAKSKLQNQNTKSGMGVRLKESIDKAVDDVLRLY